MTKGLVNPEGTTIIEIPEELKDEPQLIATPKSHASNSSSFQVHSRRSFTRIVEVAQPAGYEQGQSSFRPQRVETSPKREKPVEVPKTPQVMASRTKADETYQDTSKMPSSSFDDNGDDDDFSNVKFRPKFSSSLDEIKAQSERGSGCQSQCTKGKEFSGPPPGLSYSEERESDAPPPRRRVSSLVLYDEDLTPDLGVYPPSAVRKDGADMTCDYLNPPGASCEFKRCSKSSMKRQGSCQSSKTSSISSGVFAKSNLPDDVEKELRRMEAEERLQIERDLANYQRARRILVASTTMGDLYGKGRRCKSSKPTPFCP